MKHGNLLLLILMLTLMLTLSLFLACGDDDDGDDDDEDRPEDDDDADDDDSTVGASPFQFILGPDQMDYDDTVKFCEDEVGNGYHVPSMNELRLMTFGCPGTIFDGECPVYNECTSSDCRTSDCNACASGEGPSNGCYAASDMSGVCISVWSSKSVSDKDDRQWILDFGTGRITDTYLENDAIWPLCIK